MPSWRRSPRAFGQDARGLKLTIEYHVGRTEEHLRLLRDGEQLEDHLAHAATRLLMGLALREVER